MASEAATAIKVKGEARVLVIYILISLVIPLLMNLGTEKN